MVNDHELYHKLYDSWVWAKKKTNQKTGSSLNQSWRGKKQSTDERETGRRKQVERVKDELLHSWRCPKERGNKERERYECFEFL